MKYISKSKQYKIDNSWDAKLLFDVSKKEYGSGKEALSHIGRTSSNDTAILKGKKGLPKNKWEEMYNNFVEIDYKYKHELRFLTDFEKPDGKKVITNKYGL